MTYGYFSLLNYRNDEKIHHKTSHIVFCTWMQMLVYLCIFILAAFSVAALICIFIKKQLLTTTPQNNSLQIFLIYLYFDVISKQFILSVFSSCFALVFKMLCRFPLICIFWGSFSFWDFFYDISNWLVRCFNVSVHKTVTPCNQMVHITKHWKRHEMLMPLNILDKVFNSNEIERKRKWKRPENEKKELQNRFWISENKRLVKINQLRGIQNFTPIFLSFYILKINFVALNNFNKCPSLKIHIETV